MKEIILNKNQKRKIYQRKDGKLLYECTRCGKFKEKSAYNMQRRKGRKPIVRSRCRQCYDDLSRKERLKNKTKATNRSYKNNLKQYYKITEEDYNNFAKTQKYKCYICHKPLVKTNPKFIKYDGTQLDHCHKTGTVRGILCIACNFGLGCFKDSVKNFKRAIKYLEKSLH